MRSDCLHRSIDALLCPTVYIDMRTFARKRLGDRKPDSCRRSRHQRDFPSKSQIHVILRRKTRALLSSGCWLCLSRLLPVPCRFPFDPLEIQYKDGVEDWDQQQGDESSDGQSTDLGVAQGFPERATFKCERKQSKDGCSHGDHYGSNTLNSGIWKSALGRFAL